MKRKEKKRNENGIGFGWWKKDINWLPLYWIEFEAVQNKERNYCKFLLFIWSRKKPNFFTMEEKEKDDTAYKLISIRVKAMPLTEKSHWFTMIANR